VKALLAAFQQTTPHPRSACETLTLRHTSGLQSAYLFFIVEHMSREALGNFELMVMLALIRLGDAAYGVPISKIIEESTNREVLVGSVYAALERLEAKGFVLSEVGEPTPERGGRAKRYFRITDNGLRQVRDTRGALVKLWKGIPALQGGTR
jgi:PadR family transcriptional regulator PadR